jgi:hypothetical protein
LTTGILKFGKCAWKLLKRDFGLLEENLGAAKYDVIEEIRLASEQHRKCELLGVELKENQIRRLGHFAEIEESQLHRSTQLADANENPLFRSQQMIALAEAKELQVQRVIKEEGNLTVILR